MVIDENWKTLIRQYDQHIGKKYRCYNEKDIYTFMGIMHGEDDYYYVMSHQKTDEISFLTCVADLEDFALEKIKEI